MSHALHPCLAAKRPSECRAPCGETNTDSQHGIDEAQAVRS
jgi:hypothetical protein